MDRKRGPLSGSRRATSSPAWNSRNPSPLDGNVFLISGRHLGAAAKPVGGAGAAAARASSRPRPGPSAQHPSARVSAGHPLARALSTAPLGLAGGAGAFSGAFLGACGACHLSVGPGSLLASCSRAWDVGASPSGGLGPSEPVGAEAEGQPLGERPLECVSSQRRPGRGFSPTPPPPLSPCARGSSQDVSLWRRQFWGCGRTPPMQWRGPLLPRHLSALPTH